MFLILLVVNGYQRSRKIDQDHQAQISGTLRDFSCRTSPGGRRHVSSTSCLLNLNESPRQLELASDTYARILHGQIPSGLRTGAKIDILADRADWQPANFGIVQIHGLTVDGVKVFGADDFSRMQSSQRSTFFLLLLGSAGYVAFCLFQVIGRQTSD
jgi:hypothetical protein